MSARAYRYGSWSGGRDPLEPPYDVASALDRIGEQVLDGASPRQALRDLLRRGADGLKGLDDLRRQVAKRQRQARQQGRLDGTLQALGITLKASGGKLNADAQIDATPFAALPFTRVKVSVAHLNPRLFNAAAPQADLAIAADLAPLAAAAGASHRSPLQSGRHSQRVVAALAHEQRHQGVPPGRGALRA